ncbi:MAG: response regulator transcription factor [Actinomycetales bacterium]|nr:response regulator transcription factor [Actinomycetales bacterium]
MPQGDVVRVLLVDDQPLFRTAIASLVNAQDDFTVVGEAENGLIAVERAHELAPDLIVMDVEMPVMDGVEATRLLTEQMPGIRIVMLTVSDSEEHLFDAVRNGASGYLLKDLRPDQLYDMLRSVMRGDTPISPGVAGLLLSEVRSGNLTAVEAPTATQGPPITARELEILQLVAEGLSNKQIGRRLSITEGTVKNHVHNALEKLHLDNRIQAASYIVRQGLGRAPDQG